MKKLVITFIASIIVQLTTTFAVADTTCLKKCIGSLNAFEIAIKDGKSNISSDWVRGTAGWLLMNAQGSRKIIDEINNHVGNMKDILSCSEVGVSSAELDLFVLAFHGYLPADPFEDLSECVALMLLAMPEMDRKLGSQRSQSLGFSIGKRFGATITQLNYLYPKKNHTVEQVQARAKVIAASLSHMPVKERKNTIKYYLSKCTCYHIQLESLLQGVGIEIR